MHILRIFTAHVERQRRLPARAALALTLVLALAACGRSQPSGPPSGGRHPRRHLRGPGRHAEGAALAPAEVGRHDGGTRDERPRGDHHAAGVLRLDERRTAQISSLLEGQVVSLGAELGAAVARARSSPRFTRPPGGRQDRLPPVRAASCRAHGARTGARGGCSSRGSTRKKPPGRQADFEAGPHRVRSRRSRSCIVWARPGSGHALLSRARRMEAGSSHEGPARPYLRLASPVAGRVIARDVIIGQHVLPNIGLFTVSDCRGCWAVLRRAQPDLPFLGGRTVRIRSPCTRPDVGRADSHVGDVRG